MYPPYLKSLDAWRPADEGPISLDLEFDRNNRPTILGLSSGGSCVSVSWVEGSTDRFIRELYQRGYKFSGHNVISADKPIIDRLVRPTKLNRWEDTLIRHWLCNSYFTTMPKAGKDDTDSDTRGMGLLDLWSFASLYTSLPQWKLCRDGQKWFESPGKRVHCSGPCPVHDKFHYNALDSLSVDIGFSQLMYDFRQKGIPERLYSTTVTLVDIARRMQEQGVRVDRPYIHALDKEFEESRANLFPKGIFPKRCGVCKRMKAENRPCKKCREGGKVDDDGYGYRPEERYVGPFNPASTPQALGWYHKHGVLIEDTKKETLREYLDDPGEISEEALTVLDNHFAWKDEGKGIKSWFDGKYISDGDLLHSRWNPCATSTGRWGCGGPNLQNVPRAGKRKGPFGRARAAVLPLSSEEILVGADVGQLEYRVVLWYAFVKTLGMAMPTMEGDIFDYLLPKFGDQFDRLAQGMKASARDVLKTVAYGSQYLEGIKVYKGVDLESERTKKAVAAGAIVLHPDWELGGGRVGFTGVNLAKRLFGRATYENRIKALAVQETYFAEIPQVRNWHRSLSQHAEAGFIKTHTGRYLTLAGSLEDRMKAAAAQCGQGGGFDVVEEAITKYNNAGELPYLMIHDELIFSRPRSHSVKAHNEFMQVMAEPSKHFEGLRVPIKTKIGENWLEMKGVRV